VVVVVLLLVVLVQWMPSSATAERPYRRGPRRPHLQPPWPTAVGCRGAHTLHPTVGGDLTAMGHAVGRTAAVACDGR
jgi:hypothetical protein